MCLSVVRVCTAGLSLLCLGVFTSIVINPQQRNVWIIFLSEDGGRLNSESKRRRGRDFKNRQAWEAPVFDVH